MNELKKQFTWFKKTPVLCNGKFVCFVSSTKPKLHIDRWLINHPFYLKSHTLVDSEGRVEKFMKKYGLN